MYMYMYFVDTFCSLREFLPYLGCNVQCPHLMLMCLSNSFVSFVDKFGS